MGPSNSSEILLNEIQPTFMDPPATCPQCGAALPEDILQGLCPKCVARQAAGILDGLPNSPAVAGTFALTCGMILPTEQPGDRIGRYKLLQKIGEGGCGVVYMAEQEEPVRRRVALKVIKLGMDTKSV